MLKAGPMKRHAIKENQGNTLPDIAPISTTKDLIAFCNRMKGSEYLTVDTEFMREKTFWPQLCVIQIANDDEAQAIDALAPGIDLQPMYDLLDDPSILKVFHAARQDLEIFYHQTGHLPLPIFDTQIAAMVCGFGDSVGYETLVNKLAKAKIDKSSRFTDWSLRPLTAKQINYALSDVTHLRKVYERLRKKLNENGRAEWLQEEINQLTAIETYAIDVDKIFNKIKIRSYAPKFLAVLWEIIQWREEEIRKRDIPRNRFMKDEQLVDIAHHTPQTVDDLARTRGLGRRLAEGSSGKALMAAIKRGMDTAEADCPKRTRKVELPAGLGPATDLLKVLLKLTSEQTGVASKLLANSADIDLIAAFGEEADVPAMQGWRREVFGNEALKIIRGEMAISVQNGKLVLTPTNCD